uniref:Uncharacterized protein n=1 Tax=Vitis vinifera TaxID=29760 RepID=A5BUT5_VITVI|nr:hypothetical protein VITISV_026825 [Vitis vinifera]
MYLSLYHIMYVIFSTWLDNSLVLMLCKTNAVASFLCCLKVLKFLVSKLVACCIPSETNAELSGTRSSQVLSLLHQLTIGADPSLYDYIRELEPFPEIDIFDEIREFHQELCRAYSPKDHFLKVDCLQHLNNLHHCQNMAFSPNQFLFFMECSLSVCEEIFLPSTKITFVEVLPFAFLLFQFIVSSILQALHKKLLVGEICRGEKNVKDVIGDTCWRADQDIVHAVWNLVHMCGSDDANSVRALVSDFISRVGIGDPHCVVFHLPGDYSQIHVCRPIHHDSGAEISFPLDTSISEELLLALMRLLKKYLMDDSVKIIDLTSQTLWVRDFGLGDPKSAGY